jgi:hypothetical protein
MTFIARITGGPIVPPQRHTSINEEYITIS